MGDGRRYLFLHGVAEQLDAVEVDGALQPLLPVLLLLLAAAFLTDTEAAAQQDQAGNDGDGNDRRHRHCKQTRCTEMGVTSPNVHNL